MKKSNRINAVAAAALATATLVAASAFADSRPAQETWRARDVYSQDDRQNERVTIQGRVQSFTHERGGYNDGYLTGTVDRVDYRYGTLLLRDNRTGRIVNVDMRETLRRRNRIDVGDLRRGDRVSLDGRWTRDGIFRVSQVDSVRAGRY